MSDKVGKLAEGPLMPSTSKPGPANMETSSGVSSNPSSSWQTVSYAKKAGAGKDKKGNYNPKNGIAQKGVKRLPPHNLNPAPIYNMRDLEASGVNTEEILAIHDKDKNIIVQDRNSNALSDPIKAHNNQNSIPNESQNKDVNSLQIANMSSVRDSTLTVENNNDSELEEGEWPSSPIENNNGMGLDIQEKEDTAMETDPSPIKHNELKQHSTDNININIITPILQDIIDSVIDSSDKENKKQLGSLFHDSQVGDSLSDLPLAPLKYLQERDPPSDFSPSPIHASQDRDIPSDPSLSTMQDSLASDSLSVPSMANNQCSYENFMSSSLNYVQGIIDLARKQCNNMNQGDQVSEENVVKTMPSICDIIAFSPPLSIVQDEDTLPKNKSLDNEMEAKKNIIISNNMNFTINDKIETDHDMVTDVTQNQKMNIDDNTVPLEYQIPKTDTLCNEKPIKEVNNIISPSPLPSPHQLLPEQSLFDEFPLGSEVKEHPVIPTENQQVLSTRADQQEEYSSFTKTAGSLERTELASSMREQIEGKESEGEKAALISSNDTMDKHDSPSNPGVLTLEQTLPESKISVNPTPEGPSKGKVPQNDPKTQLLHIKNKDNNPSSPSKTSLQNKGKKSISKANLTISKTSTQIKLPVAFARNTRTLSRDSQQTRSRSESLKRTRSPSRQTEANKKIKEDVSGNDQLKPVTK